VPTQAEKGETFYQLHQRRRAFIIPNPWDAGSARMLAHMGFEALATTSAGFAFSIGQLDGTITREQALAHIAAMVAATDLPVSADYENGFGTDAKAVAESYRLAAATGLAGASIEDAKGGAAYEIAEAAERVRAAVEAVHSLPYRFILTARAENYLVGNPDLRDTIARLQAYQEAGADVLYAPGLRTREDIAAVVRSVDRPVNVLMGMAGINLTTEDLSAIGVKRISVGGALYRTAIAGLLRAAREMREQGTFGFTEDAVPSRQIAEMFGAT
jgi:2-methylisocitrate lyase-like PEP mutase family enzyme